MKKRSIAAAMTLLGLGALQGCGGGGGGGGAAFVPIAAVPAAAPAATPAAPAPPPEPEANVPPQTTTPTDPTACITAPQPGSTADVGNAYEGVWYQDAAAVNHGAMLVSAAGDSVGFTVPASSTTYPLESLFYGSFSFDTPNSAWQIASGKVNTYPTTTWSSLSGSGTFVAKTSLVGTYAQGTAAAKPFGPWKYELENSLAVDPSLLTGVWGGYMSQTLGSIDIASDGSFTGSTAVSSPLGACALRRSSWAMRSRVRSHSLTRCVGEAFGWLRASAPRTSPGQWPVVNLNVSPAQFATGDVVAELLALLAQKNLPAGRFCIEVTEGVFADAHAVAALKQARQQGLMVAMDDFGVGYSTLSQLPRLPLTSVKLDRSFVVNATQSEGDALIFRSIVQLACALGLVVVAEGVETQAQFDLSARCGCDAVQGYFIARPMAPMDFDQWARARIKAPLCSDGQSIAPRPTQ